MLARLRFIRIDRRLLLQGARVVLALFLDLESLRVELLKSVDLVLRLHQLMLVLDLGPNHSRLQF